jgi:HAD superfamily hydrolase (TIGR01509 family)
MMKYKVALFDLDGVVFDTEPQYTVFWGGIARQYHPEQPGLEHTIKGSTLEQIFGKFFADVPNEHASIVERLNAFEQQMRYEYVAGFERFVTTLRSHGIRTAIVTSSNRPKMEAVYAQHPELNGYFDAILTSEDFSESKPSPDCYIKGAEHFGVLPEECVVFEDSFNGLESGRESGAYVVGLSTTNPAEQIASLTNMVIADYEDERVEGKLYGLFSC